MIYYNEFDPAVVDRLRYLIKEGLLPPGKVDDRDIREIKPNELQPYRQCHFFAGGGGWAKALQLAGWNNSQQVWTGSCPCQPFSTAPAGRRSGMQDDRHLWPVWAALIKECRPARVFGEQVAGAIKQGWLDLVAHDLETEDYAVSSAVLPACSVGAPHIRQRLWFAAYPNCGGEFTCAVDAKTSRSSKNTKTHFWSNNPGIEPGLCRMVDGVSDRDKIRVLGNAIVPQLAAKFIIAAEEARGLAKLMETLGNGSC
jgi:DNA (cytosine-5)-methyltransferase 1